MKSSTNGSAPRQTLLERYAAAAGKLDVLPPDEFIAEQWSCDPSTPKRMRSKLKAQGFRFARRNGVWYVVGRPGAQRTDATPPVSGVQQQLVIDEPALRDTPVPAQLVQASADVSASAALTILADRLARLTDEVSSLNMLLAQHLARKDKASQWPEESAW